MELEKNFTCAINADLWKKWSEYVERRKKAAAVRMEKVTTKLLVQRALLEYTENHPVNGKGKK